MSSAVILPNNTLLGRLSPLSGIVHILSPENRTKTIGYLFSLLCVEVLRPSQPSGVMSSVVSLPNHTFTGQA